MNIQSNLIKLSCMARSVISTGVFRCLGVVSLSLALQALTSPLALAASSTTLSMAQVPMLALKSAPGLVMLTMSRDHRLFYAAYTDNSDLDANGVLDVGFDPNISYYGYFVPNRCYAYNTTNSRFSPKSIASATDGCFSASSSARWNGNWLNWATTSRMDALRRVLYGGYRKIDATTIVGVTVLQGAPIPSDSHIWGKEYRPAVGASTSSGPDTYDIRYYTPLPTPSSTSKQHVFMVKSDSVANGTLTLPAPSLRIVQNVDRVTGRVWNWSSSERPVGPDLFQGTTTTTNGTNRFAIAVEACVDLGSAIGREAECQGYPISAVSPSYWKPKGVLHDYSSNDNLKFGLITGSYLNNYSGGVLRKDIGTFGDEVDTNNGKFLVVNGIVNTIDKVQNYGFYQTTPSDASLQQATGTGSNEYLCGFYYGGLRNQGTCHMWGSPVAEMMYEGVRYFNAGLTGSVTPTAAFVNNVAAASSPDTKLGLPTKTTWLNPYRLKSSGGNPICSRPVQMVIADPLTSFDTDQLPGADASFSTTTGGSLPLTAADKTIVGLNVVTEANLIWSSEFGAATKKFFVGQSGSVSDGNPTAKSVTSFSNIRGHAPDETLSQGGYFAASVSRFGRVSGVNVGPGGAVAPTNLKLDTISVALGSVVPPIQLTYAGHKVSIVPVLKTISGTGVNAFSGSPSAGPAPYQETGAITGFYVDQIANTVLTDVVVNSVIVVKNNVDAAVNSGYPYMRFMISFSNAGQGTDNDMDEKAFYIMRIDPITKKLKVEVDLFYDGAGRISTIGYVISGTTADGLYQEVVKAGATATDINYLDTLAAQSPAPSIAPFRHNATRLPVGVINAASTGSAPQASRAFDFGASAATFGEFIPHDALWYAAKYGGAGILDSNGDPTNYFKINSPANLPAQMGKAFRSAAALAAVASTSVVGVGQRSLGSAAIYEANYDSLTWSSRLYAFSVALDGTVSDTPIWEASSLIPAPSLRNSLFLGRGGSNASFPLTSGSFSSMTSAEQTDFGNANIYEYLLGDKTKEERNNGTFRNRGTTAATGAAVVVNTATVVGSVGGFGSVLGDIVNSDPQIISKKDYGYTASDASYATYLNGNATALGITAESLAVGSNDGFFHLFDADPSAPSASNTAGKELLAFMPQAARENIKNLADPAYVHRYFVDGAIGVGHAKIAVPGNSTPAWRTVVVAAGGDGVQTVFAIDATADTVVPITPTPATGPATKKIFTASANNILWEINASTSGIGSKFGNVVGRPVIGKLSNGMWVAIFGNGYNSTDGTANLYVVRLDNGSIVRVIDTNNLVTGNGLGAVEAVRKTTGDKDTIDYVYAADYKGHIWRFDPNASANAALIYSAPTTRHITAEIKVLDSPTGTGHPAGGKMIFFGTGSYLTSTDPANTDVQALYGVYDDTVYSAYTSPFVVDADLSAMTLTEAAGADVRKTSVAATPAWYTVSGKKGWILPLTGANVAAGERVIAPPVRFTSGTVDAMLFTSIVPGTDECDASLDTWLTAVDVKTGGYVKAFDSIDENSIRVRGGSPRGVFVLEDGAAPMLYISQTIFNGSTSTTSYTSGAGATQTVCINGVCGTTRVLGVALKKTLPPARAFRAVWRQLK